MFQQEDAFWEGVTPLRLGSLPHLQDAVAVVGYPIGGDTISVTSGAEALACNVIVSSNSNDRDRLHVWSILSTAACVVQLTSSKVHAPVMSLQQWSPTRGSTSPCLHYTAPVVLIIFFCRD